MSTGAGWREKFKRFMGLDGSSETNYADNLDTRPTVDIEQSTGSCGGALTRRHAIVAGLVQHVGFRWATGYQANLFGLTGWVRNLDSGEVELEFQGTPKNVASMSKWLHYGPRHAKVTSVLLDDIQVIDGEKKFRMEY